MITLTERNITTNYKLEFLTHFLSSQLTQRSQWCFTFNGGKQPVKRLCFDFSNVRLLKKHKFSDSMPFCTKLFYHRLHIISTFDLLVKQRSCNLPRAICLFLPNSLMAFFGRAGQITAKALASFITKTKYLKDKNR